jgi:hypothetical protein
MPRLKVGKGRGSSVTTEGSLLFWMDDTTWELFHPLDRAEAEHRLRDRAAAFRHPDGEESGGRASLPPGLSCGPAALRTILPPIGKFRQVFSRSLPPSMRERMNLRSILNWGEVSVPVDLSRVVSGNSNDGQDAEVLALGT